MNPDSLSRLHKFTQGFLRFSPKEPLDSYSKSNVDGLKKKITLKEGNQTRQQRCTIEFWEEEKSLNNGGQ